MIRRIYAARLMGISDSEGRRLEAAEQERVLIEAERIAKECGVELDEVLREAQEIGERIQREGLEAELHRFAQEHDVSEAEVRAQYEAVLKESGL